jgi:hypothetical protein
LLRIFPLEQSPLVPHYVNKLPAFIEITDSLPYLIEPAGGPCSGPGESTSHRHTSINEQDRICSLLFPVLYNTCVIIQCGSISSPLTMVPVTALVNVIMNLRFARLEVPTAVEDSEIQGCAAMSLCEQLLNIRNIAVASKRQELPANNTASRRIKPESSVFCLHNL